MTARRPSDSYQSHHQAGGSCQSINYLTKKTTDRCQYDYIVVFARLLLACQSTTPRTVRSRIFFQMPRGLVTPRTTTNLEGTSAGRFLCRFPPPFPDWRSSQISDLSDNCSATSRSSGQSTLRGERSSPITNRRDSPCRPTFVLINQPPQTNNCSCRPT